MPAAPADIPVTIPVPAPIVATPAAPEFQEPPVVASESTVVAAAHIAAAPVTGAGNGLTVIVRVLIQPVFKVYVMTDVPAETPVTTPVADPIPEMPGDAELQLPPAVASLKFMVSPAHTCKGPVIAAGSGFTVTAQIVIQPVGNA